MRIQWYATFAEMTTHIRKMSLFSVSSATLVCISNATSEIWPKLYLKVTGFASDASIS